MVIAVKNVRSQVPEGLTMEFLNNEDGKHITINGPGERGINTWVPFQSSGKQIKIRIHQGSNPIVEYYVWDDNYKLQCSGPDGMVTILTVSGSADVELLVNVVGIQASIA